MNKVQKDRIPLTEEEADFVHDLIVRNRSTISHLIRYTLKNYFSYLYEDCISETYLTACENIEKLKEHPNPDGWIIVAARTTARRMVKNSARDLKSVPLENFVQSSNNYDVFEEALYNIWMEDGTPDKLLAELTKREREIYDLTYIKNIPTREIAKQLGISLSTVWNIQYMIREKIKYAIDKKIF